MKKALVLLMCVLPGAAAAAQPGNAPTPAHTSASQTAQGQVIPVGAAVIGTGAHAPRAAARPGDPGDRMHPLEQSTLDREVGTASDGGYEYYETGKP
jgi:hypothetical protein